MLLRGPAVSCVLSAMLLIACAGNSDEDGLQRPAATRSGSAAPDGQLLQTRVTLTGQAEVPGPGDEDGRGEMTVTLSETQICVEGEVTGLDAVTGGHLHQALDDASGGVVADLGITAPGTGFVTSCTPLDVATAREIAGDPGGFYVNLHTAAYPDGAIRGSLR